MIFDRENLFEAMPVEERALLTEGYEQAQSRENPSFLRELGQLFFVEAPAFGLAWLFFSFVICFLLLFRIEGAAPASWLLPLLVIGHAYFGYQGYEKPDSSLYPTEEYVLTNYVSQEDLSHLNKRERLKKGWHHYLVSEWGREEPSQDPAQFDEQLEKGLFSFNASRLKQLLEGKENELLLIGFSAPPSLFRILAYLIWNLGFAWTINRKEKPSSSEAPSGQSSYA